MELKLVYDPDGIDYVLIEFQGDLECEQEGSLNFLPIGSLEPIDEKKYMMKIGIYDLVGVIQELSNPILVNEKVRDKQGSVSYIRVRGVCKSKLMFANRPTPILERAMKKKKPQEKQSFG